MFWLVLFVFDEGDDIVGDGIDAELDIEVGVDEDLDVVLIKRSEFVVVGLFEVWVFVDVLII